MLCAVDYIFNLLCAFICLQPMKKFVFSVASRATGRLQIKPSGSGDENGANAPRRSWQVTVRSWRRRCFTFMLFCGSLLPDLLVQVGAMSIINQRLSVRRLETVGKSCCLREWVGSSCSWEQSLQYVKTYYDRNLMSSLSQKRFLFSLFSSGCTYLGLWNELWGPLSEHIKLM